MALALVGSTAIADSGEPERSTIVLTAAERADFATVKDFLASSLHASDARLRTFVGVDLAMFQSEVSGWDRVAIDILAEQARGSTDPVVLMSLLHACGIDRLGRKSSCDPVDVARQWTVADTQNQVAWLTLASTLRLAGDAEGARSAFVRGASASMWHESYDDGARVMTAAIPKALGPRARMALQMLALNGAAVLLLPNAAISELSFRCKDATLRDACVRIIDTIDRDGGSIFSKSIAIRMGRRYGIDAETSERRMRALDLLHFTSPEDDTRDWQEIVDATELASQAARLDRRIALGELGYAQSVLAAGGPGGRAAADRFHAEQEAARERAAVEDRLRSRKP